jgi:hypothetical protein
MIDRALRAMEVETYPIGLRISNFEGMKKAIGAASWLVPSSLRPLRDLCSFAFAQDNFCG